MNSGNRSSLKSQGMIEIGFSIKFTESVFIIPAGFPFSGHLSLSLAHGTEDVIPEHRGDAEITGLLGVMMRCMAAFCPMQV